MFHVKRQYSFPAVRKKTILTCVRKLAPIASQGTAPPGQRRSVSLRFRVAMLIKT